MLPCTFTGSFICQQPPGILQSFEQSQPPGPRHGQRFCLVPFLSCGHIRGACKRRQRFIHKESIFLAFQAKMQQSTTQAFPIGFFPRQSMAHGFHLVLRTTQQ
eukprot:jgi/Pico_ML_1/55440/g1123.t1